MILNILMLVKFFILSFQMAGSIQMIVILLSNSFEHRAYQFKANIAQNSLWSENLIHP